MTTRYQPNASMEDDVRCFVVDLPFTQNVWVDAIRWMPGTTGAVHHLGGGAAVASEAAKGRDLDAKQPGPGYPCAGGVGVRLSAGFGASGAGADTGGKLPEGSGVFVPAGSSLVLSVHYWTPGFKPGETDVSGVELWTTAARNLRPLVIPSFGVSAP